MDQHHAEAGLLSHNSQVKDGDYTEKYEREIRTATVPIIRTIIARVRAIFDIFLSHIFLSNHSKYEFE